MNVFQDQLLPFKIPVKLFYTKSTSEDANCSGPADAEKRHRNKSAGANERKTGDFSKLLDEVKADLALSESEDISEDEDQDISTARSRNERGDFGAPQASRGKPSGKRHKTSQAAQEDLEWQRAKEKIEEFLDFPGIASGKAFRTLIELKSYSEREESEKTEKRPPPCNPMPVQSSRPTAVFLRESQKSLQHLTSQEAAFLENNSIINSPKFESSQRQNGTSVFQTPVKTSQQRNLHNASDTKHNLNETKNHGPQSLQVSIQNNDQNAITVEKILKPIELLVEQNKHVIDPDCRTISPNFEEDNEASNKESSGEKGQSIFSSDHSQEEQMKRDGRAKPAHRPRTILNIAPGSTSQSKL
ncbi:uncharacterized protein LOC144770262 isoform X2 [Lissotriton helveticus]